MTSMTGMANIIASEKEAREMKTAITTTDRPHPDGKRRVAKLGNILLTVVFRDRERRRSRSRSRDGYNDVNDDDSWGSSNR